MRKNKLYIFEPLEKINRFIYKCDSQFFVSPLEEMLKDKVSYGLVVVGRKRAAVGYINGTQLKILREFSSGVPGKHRKGGQSQRRFERDIQEKEKRFYRRIINFINHEFLQIENLAGIFVGGAGNSKNKFIQDKYFDYRLKPISHKPIDLSYDGGYEGIRELLNQISSLATGIRYSVEKKLVQSFLKELSKDSGLAIYGYKEIKRALEHNIIKTLVYTEGLENVSDLVSMANKNGIKVEIISKETEEGKMIYMTFGGIIAVGRKN